MKSQRGENKKRQRTREVEIIRRIKPEPSPRREKRSRNRGHCCILQTAAINRHVQAAVDAAVMIVIKVLCRRGSGRGSRCLPERADPKELHVAVSISFIPVRHRHLLSENPRCQQLKRLSVSYVAVL